MPACPVRLLVFLLPALCGPALAATMAVAAAPAASAPTPASTLTTAPTAPTAPTAANAPGAAPASPASADATTPAETPGAAGAPAPAAAPARVEWLWELNPYYTSAAVELPLTDAPVPDGGRLPERHVYRQLFLDSLQPRILMLEASVYPLPAFGTWYKKHQRESYEDFSLGEAGSTDLNAFDAVTAGFQEPWAISAFTGSVMQFTRPEEKRTGRNRGFMGYLVSYGAKHIRNNLLIDDNWVELEWKLKGERQFRDEKLSWSFRLGFKLHGNDDISDVAYIGLRRSNLDYQSPWLNLLNNSNLQLLMEADRHNGRFLRQEVILGRKLPIRRWRLALTLDAGVIYEDPEKYKGALADPTADRLTFVLRPNIQF
jgi:hypothetical protein